MIRNVLQERAWANRTKLIIRLQANAKILQNVDKNQRNVEMEEGESLFGKNLQNVEKNQQNVEMVKHPGGRPRKDEKNKRSKSLSTKCTADEYLKIARVADSRNQKISTFIHDIVVKNAKIVKPVFAPADALLLVKEVNRIGTNLNQIARKVNQGTEGKAILSEIEKTHAALIAILETLKNPR